MTLAINSQDEGFKGKKQFQEFIFIGNNLNKSLAQTTEQLNLAPNSELISNATVQDSLLITQVYTSKMMSHQLEKLNIRPGVIVKLISKTAQGSVIVSLGNKLIGMGADIAHQIVATPQAQ